MSSEPLDPRSPEYLATVPWRLVGIKEVTVLTGLRARQIRERVKAGRFPQPVRLGGNSASRWQLQDVYDWIQSHSRGPGSAPQLHTPEARARRAQKTRA